MKSIAGKIKGAFETNLAFREVVAERSDLNVLRETDIPALQQVLLGMMDDIHAVCEKHGLTYVIAGGSALGAYRHGGFVPWDGDMDVAMPRADYDRFLDMFEGETAGRYYVQAVEKGRGFSVFGAKIRKRGTVYTELFESEPGVTGVFIDVYPIEDCFDSPLRDRLHGIRCELLMLVCSCVKMKTNSRQLLPYLTNKKLINAVRRKARLGSLFSLVVPLKTWLRLTERALAKKDNPGSTYITIPSGVKHYFGETFTRASFFPAQKVPFADRTYWAMADPAEYLAKEYGAGFMDPPPPEKRQEHHAVLEFRLQ